jgi:hypothetical protein
MKVFYIRALGFMVIIWVRGIRVESSLFAVMEAWRQSRNEGVEFGVWSLGFLVQGFWF